MKPSSTMPVGDSDPRLSGAQETPPEVPPDSTEPISQQPKKKPGRTWKPLWFQQLPVLNFNPPPEKFELLDPEQLKALLKDADPAAREKIMRDIRYLDHQVLRLFRDRDYKASLHQNRYRMFQLAYMLLALLATIVGSFLALSLQSSPALTPYLGALEAILAGVTTFFATLSTDEPPQQLWLQNRLRAEFLRREYFRYLMNLEPYTSLGDFDREQRLAYRAADINRGVFPENNSPLKSG